MKTIPSIYLYFGLPLETGQPMFSWGNLFKKAFIDKI